LRHASPTRAGPALGGGARWVGESACATASIWSIEPTRRVSRRRNTDGSSVDANRRVVGSVNDFHDGQAPLETRPAAGDESADARARGRSRAGFEVCADKRPNRSRVHPELALRPGCSARTRMPPTARACATRREAGVTGFDCGGRCGTSTGVTPPARWQRPNLIERSGGSRPSPFCADPTGDGKA
jgi:hypothetical protein